MNKQREFTYEDGFEDGIESEKEECIELLEGTKEIYGDDNPELEYVLDVVINKIKEEV